MTFHISLPDWQTVVAFFAGVGITVATLHWVALKAMRR